MSKNTLMPFSYGGGINSLHDIERCLNLGCDKVSLNNIIRKDKKFLNMAINEFGSQAIVVSIDYVLEDNLPILYDHVSSKKIEDNFDDFLSFIHDQNCGEILLSSVNHNGHLKGYDLSVLKKYRDKIDCPIIINGGCGSPENMINAFEIGSDACGAGSIFYYTKYGYKDIKDTLREKKINVR